MAFITAVVLHNGCALIQSLFWLDVGPKLEQGTHDITASQPGKLTVASDSNWTVRHPLGLFAVITGGSAFPQPDQRIGL
ncbi:MAG: hypothetical protein ACK5DY_10645, partial [Bacteroidota bacterium]